MTSTLYLSAEHYAALCRHAARDPLREVCGLMGGRWQPYDVAAYAERCVPVPNIAPNPATTFLMERRIQVRVMYEFEAAGLDVIGIYHSHPSDPPEPSPTDLREFAYPDALYLIIAPAVFFPAPATDSPIVDGYGARAWRIRRERAEPAHLVVGT